MTQHKALQAGNVAVITGAGDGIGLAMAKYCLSIGMEVCLADINEAGLEEVARDLGDLIENRPALSRWHPDYSASFQAFMNLPGE